jgi:hypothetical protein
MQFHMPEIRFFPALIFTFANMILPWEFRPHHGDAYAYLNWGMIDVDWDAKPHPVAHVRVRGQDDKVKLQFPVPSVPVTSATPKKDALACKPPRAISHGERRNWRILLLAVLGVLFASFVFNVIVLVWLVWFAFSKLIALVAGKKSSSAADKKKKTN